MDVFQLMGTIAINTTDAETALGNVSSAGTSTESSLRSSFEKIGGYVATYLSTRAILEFGKAITGLAMNAETASAQVKTLLSHDTDYTAFFEEMKKASSETGVAYTDFAQAVYGAMSASVAQSDAIGFVTDAIKLAKGGFTDAATAVDVLTTAMNAYGDESMTAAYVSDILITTQNLGKTTVGELASSMGRLIPTAAGYGVSIENLAAGYATLTKNGIATAEATTYMRSMLKELADGGSDVSKILQQKTGKSFSELIAKGYSLGDVMGIVLKSVKGNTTEFANLWSSTEAGTGALTIAQTGADEFNATLAQMSGSAGATQDAYSTMADTVAEKMQRMKVTAENAGITAGDSILTIISGMIDKLAPLLETTLPQLAELFGNIMTLAEPIITLLTDVLSVVITIVNEVFGAINDAIESIKEFFGGGEEAVIAAQEAHQQQVASNADRSMTQQLAGRYAGYTTDQQWAVQNLLSDMLGGYDMSDALNEMIDSGLDRDTVNTIQSDIAKAVSEADFSLEASDAWFDDVPVKLQQSLDGADLDATVTSATFDSAALQGLQSQLDGLSLGASVFINGQNGGAARHANGVDFVTRDQTPALLHYGEAVLNRTDAKRWRDGSGTEGMVALADKLDAMLQVLTNGFVGMNQPVVLDSGALVGQLGGRLDATMGRMATRKIRG